ncbi:MAG: glutamate synthase subunit alpha [Gammaproteobacteria bacterium]|nr:glutamate synthase subunit alpha [Gammaproteobacteria bacterium]
MSPLHETVPSAPSPATDTPAAAAEIRSAGRRGLYSGIEHDACGVGLVAHIKGVRTHAIVRQALGILESLDHRGAVGADPLMGDGSGLLIQIPDAFYRAQMQQQGVTLPPPGEYGVGMIFLPKEPASRQACVEALERAIRAEGQHVLGWREVPVDASVPMSPAVRASAPLMRQVFIGRSADILVPDALERKLYVIRKRASASITALELTHCSEYYVPSMSCRTVIYKGLLLADQVGKYYLDLQDKRVVSALAVVHQRFSTNTFPSWPLAHPYRMVAHNGEINTIKGNFNWMRARQGVMSSPVLGDDLRKLYPITLEGQSDTATFDNTLELLVMAGYPLAQAMMMMIPEAWEQHALMDEQRRAFYEYHAAMLEPWDGPAAMVFTDGRQIGATLDRNGLRPARYIVTDDELVVLASEAGVLPIPEERIVRKSRLQPGRMLLIDLEQGRIIEDEELKAQHASAHPYRRWINNVRIHLGSITPLEEAAAPERNAPLLDIQQAFGMTQEDLGLLLAPMARGLGEPIGAMGNDAPLAVLSGRGKPLYGYFRQLFAQVTNPPIDPIREAVVMSLVSFIGPRPNLLDINAVNPPIRLEVEQPLLDGQDILRLRQIAQHTGGKLRSCTLDISYPVAWGREGIEARLAALCARATDAIESGCNILILSDRQTGAERVAIAAPLALSAIHHHLIRLGLRTAAGLVVETGSAWEVHHFAVLAGYGAEAVHPWLALDTVADMAPGLGMSAEDARHNFIKAIGKGLSKTMSKMGISTYMSYCGAQIFEAVGLDRTLVDTHFTGTASQIGGMDIFELADEALRTHQRAFGTDPLLATMLDTGGDYAWRQRGEEHMWTPDAIARLQHGVRAGDYADFEEYARIINDQSRRQMTLRGLFEFRCDPQQAVPLEEVESAVDIVRRFATGAMSLGSISPEAHLNLAIAMNRIGGKSNTGEGGEDPARYRTEAGGGVIAAGTRLGDMLGDVVEVDYTLQQGDSLRSKIKQVASGRFGVTTGYLVSAEQIQIKMAQGAKPGEGGQLPGNKVSEYIGRLRHSVPGVGLISPPPHHDIYSIEDLAQLIHDLKSVNPRAEVSVKLVSEIGVGTVAAGVTKARADHIVIAGHDGGTGAAPWSSIKHAGTPWELGLAETQQTLVLNRLRGRVRVQVDGQIKTGRDVVIAALLGADEFGFATAPLVASGCIMMRKCHLNICPVGIATQDPVLRKRFAGSPEHVVNFFFFVAEEVRRIMARLGIRRFDELVGRSDLLDTRPGVRLWKTRGLDLSRILAPPTAPEAVDRRHRHVQDHGLDKAADIELIARVHEGLRHGGAVRLATTTRNVERSVGAMLSGDLVRHYPEGLDDDRVRIEFTGTGGQSFAAFLARGLSFRLTGEANDYTGKGLSGGRLVVRPPPAFAGDPARNIIVGNTVLYGATSGEAFFCGMAGERFAVRLSGASAVVEGVGDHGCEYMTGGTVLVLGKTGRNFAAGMSGGIAFVYDEDGSFAQRCNTALVSLEPLLPAGQQAGAGIPLHQGMSDEALLRQLLNDHLQWTGSARARSILAEWPASRARFVKVFPHEYRRALQARSSTTDTPPAAAAAGGSAAA